MALSYMADKRFTNGLRTGEQYIDDIKNDGRRVFINGEQVEDITTHPSFCEAVRSIAALYDISSDPDNRKLMSFISPKTDCPVNRIWQIPKNIDDMYLRKFAIERWAEETFGLMGRTPDHVAGFFVGWASNPKVFETEENNQMADNLMRFFEFARDNDKYITYTIIPPQIDRSKSMHQQDPSDLYAGVTEETSDGIIIHGAQMLGTGTALSDYVCLSQITPLNTGDENYAINVVVPCNAPGLKIYSRKSYALSGSSTFDYPLASRYDETDSLVVFDNVFVPWEQVFVFKNIKICRDQWWKTSAHSMGNHQAQIRLCVKLKFLMGLSKRIAEMNGVINLPAVSSLLGEMASYAAMLERLVEAQIATSNEISEGVVEPGRQALYAAIVLQAEVYPKILNWMRELCGGGVIQLPSSYLDFKNPEIRSDIDRYIKSPEYNSEEKVKLLKLAWDIIGSEFAGRHEQYEKFYAGPPFVAKSRMYQAYDFKGGDDLVKSALDGYNLEGVNRK